MRAASPRASGWRRPSQPSLPRAGRRQRWRLRRFEDAPGGPMGPLCSAAASPARLAPPDLRQLSLGAAGRPPGADPPTPLAVGTGQRPHSPRTRLAASAPGDALLAASAPPGPSGGQSSPASGPPAPGPVSGCGPRAPASSPGSVLASLGPGAASAAGPCVSLASAPASLPCSLSGLVSLAPFGICFPDSFPGVWGQPLGPGRSGPSGWAAAGASAGGVGVRLPS